MYSIRYTILKNVGAKRLGAETSWGRNIQSGAKRLGRKRPGRNVLEAKPLGQEMVSEGRNDSDSITRHKLSQLIIIQDPISITFQNARNTRPCQIYKSIVKESPNCWEDLSFIKRQDLTQYLYAHPEDCCYRICAYHNSVFTRHWRCPTGLARCMDCPSVQEGWKA